MCILYERKRNRLLWVPERREPIRVYDQMPTEGEKC